MLTQNQEKYLLKIPEDKKVKIVAYNPKVKEVVNDIKRRVVEGGINLEVAHMGASALGISGQGDIDLYILCNQEDFNTYLPLLEKTFGPKVPGISINRWDLQIDGFEVEMYLTDLKTPSMKRQVDVFEKLKNNKELLREYESVKLSANNLSFREYMGRKYEFFNKILKIFSNE